MGKSLQSNRAAQVYQASVSLRPDAHIEAELAAGMAEEAGGQEFAPLSCTLFVHPMRAGREA